MYRSHPRTFPDAAHRPTLNFHALYLLGQLTFKKPCRPSNLCLIRLDIHSSPDRPPYHDSPCNLHFIIRFDPIFFLLLFSLPSQVCFWYFFSIVPLHCPPLKLLPVPGELPARSQPVPPPRLPSPESTKQAGICHRVASLVTCRSVCPTVRPYSATGVWTDPGHPLTRDQGPEDLLIATCLGLPCGDVFPRNCTLP